MKSIERTLKTLENRAKKKREELEGQYCRKHLPPPTIIFDPDNPPEPVRFCEICQKPFPPDFPQATIIFGDAPLRESPADLDQ